MLRFLADENFVRAIVKALWQHDPSIEVVLAQEIGLTGVDDKTLLAIAAEQRRIVLTHDVRTLKNFAYDRVRQGLPMPGVLEVSPEASRRVVIEELLIIHECCEPDELENRVVFIPL